MKNFSLMILVGLAVLGLAGCPGNATNTTGNGSNSRSNTTVSNANTINSNVAVVVNSNTANANGNAVDTAVSMTTPNGFMTEAAKGGMAEVELSRLATTKAQNAEVKKFAQKMIEDHTNANTEMKQLAGKKNVTLPTELDAEHKAIKDNLSGLSGAEFDKAYVNAMVSDHEKTVLLFKKQSDGGTDADAKAFASKTLPKLQMHLDMIKGIESKMK
ncbi:MAG: DUF4142 domain-containing protein [Acidobacteria bacterium]|jgi:putative membrane protein|nr:DUF4142 domain-containing protein [Acidobacteriota bacterium]MBA4124866.1 DUF4142 domain-containing protein [Acidobacteriota bacterium]